MIKPSFLSIFRLKPESHGTLIPFFGVCSNLRIAEMFRFRGLISRLPFMIISILLMARRPSPSVGSLLEFEDYDKASFTAGFASVLRFSTGYKSFSFS